MRGCFWSLCVILVNYKGGKVSFPSLRLSVDGADKTSFLPSPFLTPFLFSSSSLFLLLSVVPLSFLPTVFIYLLCFPPFLPALLPDDIAGPQPGPFLVSVMGASLQSLPLPLPPPPPPSHTTIQHSLSLNGKICPEG